MDKVKIIWSDFSLDKIEEIATELEKDSFQAAQNVVSAIYDRPNQLKTQPHSGTPEEYLKELNLDHRFLLTYSYKIIYRMVNDNTAYITDVFPTKKDPKKIEIHAKETNQH